MERVICLIDGFNLYHSIARLDRPRLKWCNYRALAERFLVSGQRLERVLYFTAIATHYPSKAQKHGWYIQALEEHGVETVLGRFKRVKRKCPKCGKSGNVSHEKETDVNMAIRLSHLAHTDAFDTALLVSGDSDFASAIRFVRQHFPHKKIGVVFPVSSATSADLTDASTFFRYMTQTDLKKSLLPDVVTLSNGKVIFNPFSPTTDSDAPSE